MAKDVAEALGFTRTDVANRICMARVVLKKAKVPTEKVETLFDFKTQPSVTLIPESDLYRLVMRSNPPSAKHSKAGSVKPLSLQSAKTVPT